MTNVPPTGARPGPVHTGEKFETARLLSHLQLKWGTRPCPMCGVAQWTVPTTIFQISEFHGGSFLVVGGPIIPVLPIMCGNCGNTVLVNALVAGVLDPQTGQPR